MDATSFFNLCKQTSLHELFNGYLSNESKQLLNTPILSGCDWTNNLDENKKLITDIDVRTLVGQIGKYTSCCCNLCGGSRSALGSTWLSPLLDADRLIHRGVHGFISNNGVEPYFTTVLQRNPREYVINFFTPDNGKTYYTDNCSNSAIVIKGIIILKNQLTGSQDYRLKNIQLINFTSTS